MKSIVLVIHGCPIRWLGPYGNEWIATPNLDRFAANGVVFDRHYSENPSPIATREAWQLDSLRAEGVFTAVVRANRAENDLHPDYYARWNKVFDARPDPTAITPMTTLIRGLPSILAELHQHERWSVTIECDVLIPPWDVPNDIFEVYVEDLVDAELNPEAVAEEPLLAWTDPKVGWFDADDHDAEELLHTSYAAAMTAFDADFGRFCSAVSSKDALIIVTSDFGWSMGEHGILGPHRPWLHEEVVHVPYLLQLPTNAFAGHRVSGLTVPADLGMLLRDWHRHVELSPRFISSRTEVRSEFTLDGARERAIRTPRWTLLLPTAQHPEDENDTRTPKLYAMPDDRWEVNDLATRHPDVVDELAKQG